MDIVVDMARIISPDSAKALLAQPTTRIRMIHNYPWKEWSDGEWRLLTCGEDYIHLDSLVQRSRHWSQRNGGKWTIASLPNNKLLIKHNKEEVNHG